MKGMYKVGISKLDFSKDKEFRADLAPSIWYIIRFKRRWWSKWKYIIDNDTHCPQLFRTQEEAINALNFT